MGGVCGVQNSYSVGLAVEEGDHVFDGCLVHLLANLATLWMVRIVPTTQIIVSRVLETVRM
jgi:hypothetical protein